MNVRMLLPFFVALCAGSATAMTCDFTTECYETDGCSETSFTMDVDIPLQTVTTDFGDLDVVAVKSSAGTFVMFATGDGAEYMLTTNDDGARFTTHLTDGPAVISYLGSCEDQN